MSKLKEECFGGESGGSSGFGISTFDGWGMGGGGYGKSGYMLFYERRKKKPLTVLVKEEEAASESGQQAADGEKLQKVNKTVYDDTDGKWVQVETNEKVKEEKKDEETSEKRLEVDYKQAVLPTAVPNKIFSQVLQDNRKFGFENDIYSSEFFDFALGLQKSVIGMDGDSPAIAAMRRRAIDVGGKVTLEILAKAFANSCIDEHMAVLAEAMQKDPSLPREFLASWYDKDGFAYLFSLLLECPDTRARQSVASLLKYVLVTLKMQEQDYLFEAEDYEVEGDDGQKMTMQRHRALCARFVVRAIELLNTKVAKNWARFDQFHELLYTFALADVADVVPPRLG